MLTTAVITAPGYYTLYLILHQINIAKVSNCIHWASAKL